MVQGQYEGLNLGLRTSSEDRMIFGVCGGIAKHFGWDSWMVRTLFVVGVLALGLTPILYLIFAFSFLSDKPGDSAAENKRILGVCARLAQRMDWDVSMVRSAFACSLLISLVPSFGTTLLIYFVLYFFMPSQGPIRSSERRETIDVKGRRKHL